MNGKELLDLDDPIWMLDRFDDEDQLLKDKIAERLLTKSELEPATDCMIYLGFWEENGQAKVRVGGKVYVLSRVAAWVYFPEFKIYGDNRAVRTCCSPACFNPEHLLILPDQAAALQYQRQMGRLGEPTHRLTRVKADLIRALSAEGKSVEDLAADPRFNVRPAAIRAILKMETWRPK